MSVQVFRLWPRRPLDGSLPLGLSLDDEGLLLAGNCRLIEACLDRDGHLFYRARPVLELSVLLSAAYGARVDAAVNHPAIERIAKLMTKRNWTRARLMALHLRLPELADASAAAEVLKADRLLKVTSSFDPLKHPRWPKGSEEGHGGEFSSSNGSGLLIPAQWQGPLLQAVVRILGRLSPRVWRSTPRNPFRPKPAEIPPEEVDTGIGHNNPPEPIEDEAAGSKPRIPELPAERPVPGSEITKFGRAVANALAQAISIGDAALAQAIAAAAEKVGWLTKEYPNIISFLDPARTYEELTEAAQQRGRHDGYEDHHIVGQGRYNSDIDQDQIQDSANIVRIPEYKHRMINTYYDTEDPALGGLTPREFLKSKSFEEQFQFGLNVLRKFGVMK